jgi:hypothetical protein
VEFVRIVSSFEGLDGVTLFVERNLMTNVTVRVAHFGWCKPAQEATRARMLLFLKARVEAGNRVSEDFRMLGGFPDRGIVNSLLNHLDLKLQLLNHFLLDLAATSTTVGLCVSGQVTTLLPRDNETLYSLCFPSIMMPSERRGSIPDATSKVVMRRQPWQARSWRLVRKRCGVCITAIRRVARIGPIEGI